MIADTHRWCGTSHPNEIGFQGFVIVFSKQSVRLIWTGKPLLMMSKKCKYAIKTLVRLGSEFGGEYLLTDEIARAENIPKKFLELILLDLKHAGYLRSKQGSKGGYRLVQDPSQITLAEIYRLFDGAIALVPCVSQKFYEACDDCPDEKTCRLKRVFIDVREKTFELMSGITIQTFLNDSNRLELSHPNIKKPR
jgi:Rrf2 family protein